jgi:hypothetical protein
MGLSSIERILAHFGLYVKYIVAHRRAEVNPREAARQASAAARMPRVTAITSRFTARARLAT